MGRDVFLWLHFIRHGHFAERFGDDALNVCKAADDFETNAYVAVGDARLDGARQIVSHRVPDRIALRISRKLYRWIRDNIKTQLLRGHSRRNRQIG